MPTQSQIARLALGGGLPGYPSGGSGRGSSLTDLIMYQGQLDAQAAQQQGDIWGNAISGAGQAIAGGIEKNAADKKIKARDAAWLSVLNDPATMGDPKALFSKSNEIWGPEDGPKMFQGVAGAVQLMQPKRNPEADQKALGVLAPAYLKMQPGGRAAIYPQIRASINGAFPEFGRQMPEQHDPAFDESVVLPFVTSLGGTPELTKGQPGDVFFDPATGAQKFSIPPTPKEEKPETRGLDVQAAEALSRGDTTTYQRLLKVKAEMGRADDRPPVPIDPNQSNDDASLLLQGGTADKIPIKARSSAVAEARKSGGIDGTGFVPMNGQQQQKYTDFMTLRSKATRLQELLSDPEVSGSLGPASGRYTGATKEFPLIGASTKVKEAFDLFHDLSDTELRRRSGAAISPGEYQRITGFTVDPTKQADSNGTNLTRMLETIDSSLNTIGATNLPHSAGGASSSGAPKVGTVVRGYRYRGGNPSSPSSWEKQ